jgi:hypothetical protein
MDVRITLQARCHVGDTCGTFVLSFPCAGTLTFIGQGIESYEFRSDDKTGLCTADGRDFLRLLPDGKIAYDSRSDYGQAVGILTPIQLPTSAESQDRQAGLDDRRCP